ncbi:DNA-binding protein [Acinetobacter ursingii]|uniref:DNA-binding protein n=1 Tax=Acinetobacter ursingii TaxID=108980 RepID=UPI00244BAD26|nr:DNA-binding protein [Acinetobacter ursingii]MDG9993312.1 DNA-binding protein [Acinetobacter ursingii]MDH0205464.1 DNA-binding protein [Acinetobacter ursingii]
MSKNAVALTPEQVKKNLNSQGKTLKQFAIDHNFNPNDVYRVLNGSRKGLYGKGHEIAVALGLKPSPVSIE